jgi:hypothetical protein
MLKLARAIILGALLFAVPSSALASTATANIADPAGDVGASFDAVTDIIGTDVTWDGQSLTVRVVYASYRAAQLSLLLSDGVDRRDSSLCAADSADSIEVEADSEGDARLTMPYIDGTLAGDTTSDDTSITYRFSSAALTDAINRGRDPFTCASGSADGDDFFGGFAGKTLRITSANATAALTAALQQRYGQSFSAASRKWLKCPRVEIFPESDDFAPNALCEFEFSLGNGRYRGGYTTAILVSGVLDASSELRSRAYGKALSPCRGIPRTKRGWVNGAYLTGRSLRNTDFLGRGRSCRGLVGGAGMAGDIEYLATRRRPLRHVTVGLHGTNRLGFEDRARFPCRVRRSRNRYAVACANKLGDRFVYRFVVRRR